MSSNDSDAEPGVTIGDDFEMDTDDFVEILHNFDHLVVSIDQIELAADKLESSGLDRDDVIRLLYGRGLGPLSEIEALFETVDDIGTMTNRDALSRLVASRGSFSLEQTDEFINEMHRLNKKYADLGADDE